MQQQKTQFALRLAGARQARGLTQLELATLAGVSRSLVAKLEIGQLDPLTGRFDTVVRLCRVLRLSLDDVVRDIVPRQKNAGVVNG